MIKLIKYTIIKKAFYLYFRMFKRELVKDHAAAIAHNIAYYKVYNNG